MILDFATDFSLGFVVGGVGITIFIGACWYGPVVWRWFKYSVWRDNRYAAGYRKGMEDGRRVERDLS